MKADTLCCSVITVHMVSPTLEHYTCLVDLIGVAGHLHEAENMTKAMPCKLHVSALNALLRACRIHGNVEIGEKWILDLDPENAAGYVLLSKIYAAASTWQQASL